jgi:hypothetical protein
VTDPKAPNVYANLPLPEPPLGVIGTPSVTGQGGVLNLLARAGCDAGACVQMRRVLFPPNAPPTLNAPIVLRDATYTGSPGFGSYRRGGPIDIVATRATRDTTFRFLIPLNNAETSKTISFPMLGPNLKPIAIAECAATALVVETNADLQLYAVPLGGSTPAAIPIGHSGQGVYFEPYTSTVLAPFNQGPGFELSAFTLGGTPSAPTLERRTDWAPPADLRPIIVATRTPLDFPCPGEP